MDQAKRLSELWKNSIRVDFLQEEGAAAGLSRFGGEPDVPEGFRWPYFETDTYDDTAVKPRPLSFLAQFSCEELALYDKEGLLPAHGVISFFYEVGSQRWGFDPKDAGCAKVYWFEDTGSLKKYGFPGDLPDEYRFPPIRLSFSEKPSLPFWEDYSSIFPDDKNWEAFDEARQRLGLMEEEEENRLLGWPDIIQNNMTEECELVTKGYYLGGSREGIPVEDRRYAAERSVEDWQLLFQLGTVSGEGFSLMFGDCGRIYFYIRKEDLLARRFEKIWLILQCG